MSRFQSSKPVIVERPVVDGVMVEIRGEAYASKSGKLLHWSFGGYNGAIPLQPVDKVLTPPSIIAILAAGYKPRWHTSAYYWDGK